MRKIAVSLSIDVTKIDKSRLYKGQKGTYLDATVFLDLVDADQFGNHGMITQSVTKEEKEGGIRGAILGNGKIIWRDEADAQSQRQRQPDRTPARQQAAPDFDDDLPF